MLRNMAIATRILPDGLEQGVLDSIACEFSKSFAELERSAERTIAGRSFVFSQYGKELYPCFEKSDAALAPGCIVPVREGRPVASVDSTCVLVGECSEGALYAARAAVGISYEGTLRRFFRLGPLLALASDSGLTGVEQSCCSSELSAIAADSALAERVIRNSVERRVVEALLKGEEEAIVVTDGSLSHPLGQLRGPPPARGNAGTSLVGFSKSSSLILSETVVAALSHAPFPSYCKLREGAVTTVLAKFSTTGLVFRVDFAPGGEAPERTLGRMLWNDAFASGYPDSLKVAHHLSVFSKADDEALKAYVTRRFQLRPLPTFSLRRIALGSFRGGG